MPIDAARLAHAMDLQKSLRMSLDECHIALGEAYFGLTDGQFHDHAIPNRHNIATIVMHVLQQHDEFNAVLQERRGIVAAHGWRHLDPQERFRLVRVPAEHLPKPGDEFLSVAEVRAIHETLHAALLGNLEALSSEELMSGGDERWPHLADRFFRMLWHAQVHVRQIWLLRGAMGLTEPLPVQHYA